MQAAGRTLSGKRGVDAMSIHADEGEGKLSLATKLSLNDNVLMIEDYANQPVMLNEIKQQK